MKHSTFVALVLMLAAAVGALTAAWLYVRRREKELDEYEQLLFSEDMDEAEAPAQEEAPAGDEPAVPLSDLDPE